MPFIEHQVLCSDLADGVTGTSLKEEKLHPRSGKLGADSTCVFSPTIRAQTAQVDACLLGHREGQQATGNKTVLQKALDLGPKLGSPLNSTVTPSEEHVLSESVSSSMTPSNDCHPPDTSAKLGAAWLGVWHTAGPQHLSPLLCAPLWRCDLGEWHCSGVFGGAVLGQSEWERRISMCVLENAIIWPIKASSPARGFVATSALLAAWVIPCRGGVLCTTRR